MKREVTDEMKNFANHVSHKTGIQHIQRTLSIKKINNSYKNEQTFQIDIPAKTINRLMADKHMKRCSTSVALQKTQIKTRKRHYSLS